MNKCFRAPGGCKYLILALLMAGAAACNKAGFSYDNIVDNTPTNYIVTDTITSRMTTVYLDSIPTSDLNVALCGMHRDPLFGKTTARSYWQVKVASNTLEEKAKYDSIVLVLHNNRTVYGDTTQLQDLGVYKVTQDIKLPTGQTFMYSKYTVQTGDQLGRIQMRLRPNLDTVIKIRLDDTWGHALFDLYRTKSEIVSSQDRFLQYLKGLALQPGPNSTVINGFRADDSLVVRMHYHLDGIEKIGKQIDFPLYNPEVQFNNIETDRSGTAFAGLGPNRKSLPSDSTGHYTYVQPLGNIATRLELPYLRNMPKFNKFFKLMRATLTIEPAKATYRYPYTLPPRLVPCEANSRNIVTDSLINPSFGGVQYGDLVVDVDYNENTRYVYDITSYCQAELLSNEVTTRGLLLIPPRTESLTRFNRALLGDGKAQENRIKIQLYYLLYK